MKFTVLLLCLGMACSCHRETKQAAQKPSADLSRNIGEKFVLVDLADSAGKPAQLDFSSTTYTIVDFWFTECPPCIQEMTQFRELLKGKERKVKMVSISINQPWYWKQGLQGSEKRIAFLREQVINWEHLVMQTKDNPKNRNTISTDRLLSLEETFGVSSFPAYFVLDSTGRIIKRPQSAVDFLNSL